MSLALAAAMTGGALMGISAPAQAVNLAQDGLGQALVFPYYNTRDGWTSLFTITNTSDRTVIAKVRWREGVNSRDVRDFNVILSPYDVWTAGTRDTGPGAGMFTQDNSCTFPKLPATTVGSQAATGIDFTNLAYTKIGGTAEDNRDNGSESLDRTKEGYFEVIEMGSILGEDILGNNAEKLAYYAKHAPSNARNNTAVPRNCDTVRSLLRNPAAAVTAGQLLPPVNVLKGEAVLVKGPAGIAAGYNPMTLANFTSTVNYAQPDSPLPNLSTADPVYYAIDDSTGTSIGPIGTPPGTADAVSALISRTTVINNYNVAGDSASSWIMAFPTKNFSVDRAIFPGNAHAPLAPGLLPLAPFDGMVNGEVFGYNYLTPGGSDQPVIGGPKTVNGTGKSCFDVNINLWDREEFDTPPSEIEDGFSPKEPGAQTNQNQLCYETNIVSFGDDNGGKGLFSSELAKSIPDAVLPGDFGWGQMTFGPAAGQGNPALPVIGMKVEIRNRGNASVNYGFANDHAYKRGALYTSGM